MSSLVSCRDRRTLSWQIGPVSSPFSLSPPGFGPLSEHFAAPNPHPFSASGGRSSVWSWASPEQHFGGALVRKGPPSTPDTAPLALPPAQGPDSRRGAGTATRAARTASGTRPARGSSPSAATAALQRARHPQRPCQHRGDTAGTAGHPIELWAARTHRPPRRWPAPGAARTARRRACGRARSEPGPAWPGSARGGTAGLTRRRGSASRATRGGG